MYTLLPRSNRSFISNRNSGNTSSLKSFKLRTAQVLFALFALLSVQTFASVQLQPRPVFELFARALSPAGPVLLSADGSTRAVAVESIDWTPEPFQPIARVPYASDNATRLTLFATNILSPSGQFPTSLTCVAEDVSHRLYPLTVESLGRLENTPDIFYIIVRLDNTIDDAGDVLLQIVDMGVASNRVRVGIGHIGDGLPDDLAASDSPVPAITSMYPSGIFRGNSDIDIAINGSGFVPGGLVRVNGKNRISKFLSASLLTVRLLAPDLAIPGPLNVSVLNPAPGGGLSNTVALPVFDSPSGSLPNTNQLPTVSLSSSLTSEDGLIAPAEVELSAAANDSDGLVSKVEFYEGSTLLGTAFSEPFTLQWSGIDAGDHLVTAVVTDNVGGVTASAPINVTVKPAPAMSSLTGSYIDPRHLTNFTFGSHSHWVQPWRAYMDTIPAHTYLSAVGINLNIDKENPDLILQMLGSHGIRNARIEVGWNNISFDNESVLTNATALRAKLLACKKWGIRPLILLNANQGTPGPMRVFNRTVAVTAPAGSRTIQLSDPSALTVRRSGFSNLTSNWAAEALVTAINRNTVSISKPLPKTINAGTSVPMATLRYRPFSVPGSADYNETVGGWNRYVATVAKFVADALGTTESTDKGFDMEIWNELTFGSNYLYINSYYNPAAYTYDQTTIWKNLVKATADFVDSNPALFQGVVFGDGFANTMPWPAASTEPSRIGAISKHPYPVKQIYPANESKSTALNALFQIDTSGFKPTYTALFPEYYATGLQTETIIRDMAPLTTNIYSISHGRNAFTYESHVMPREFWMTENGVTPKETGVTTAAAALALKAKTTARFYSFYIGKGTTLLDLYAATGGDMGYGLIQDNFLSYARSNSAYPTDDASYTSPALAVLGRISTKMKDQVDNHMTYTRSVQLESVSDSHNHIQFKGDGTSAHPDLFDRDVFAFMPFQVNAHRFIFHYYVMTRDVTKPLTPEQFTIRVSGLNGIGATISAYDPVKNVTVPVAINGRSSTALIITVTAADYPYLLTVQETGN